MKTLADELLDVLPEFPAGLTARAASARLAADYASVIKAMKALNRDGRAQLKKRLDSRELFLEKSGRGAGKGQGRRRLPGLCVCPNCDKAFRQPKWRRRCCSRKCGIALSWENPESAAKRRSAISASKQTPKAREQLAAHNRRRWSKPEEHAKLSEQNRVQWADPAAKARRSRGIRAAQQKPEQRALYAEIRRKHWQDPDKRKKMAEGIRRSKQTPEARAKFSKLLRERWQDPELRKKYEEGNRLKNSDPATKAAASERMKARWGADREKMLASIKLASEANRGRKQSPEVVAHRVAMTKAARQRRKA